MNVAVLDFRRARYIVSAHLSSQLPPDDGAEIAFAGRSNVGKSSAINAITNQNGLAKTSKTPGRTQQINFFDLENGFKLVDLPGYGFAKAPEQLRAHWGEFISEFMLTRSSLRGLVLPMDIRRPLTELDQKMLDLCWESALPVHILLTKADKMSRGKGLGILKQVENTLGDTPQTTVQLFSALKRSGVDQAREQISRLLLAESREFD
ncbi:MAG: ribosome biogenesis GTP-binding protein YihA/YsxC [Acidiferrobacterales bacterium]|nr:ribosome biogenesis GTP-binding protein YihA/YsxC [Acidiferrobacterales bacterium]